VPRRGPEAGFHHIKNRFSWLGSNTLFMPVSPEPEYGFEDVGARHKEPETRPPTKSRITPDLIPAAVIRFLDFFGCQESPVFKYGSFEFCPARLYRITVVPK
jgi:hypothetical protein